MATNITKTYKFGTGNALTWNYNSSTQYAQYTGQGVTQRLYSTLKFTASLEGASKSLSVTAYPLYIAYQENRTSNAIIQSPINFSAWMAYCNTAGETFADVSKTNFSPGVYIAKNVTTESTNYYCPITNSINSAPSGSSDGGWGLMLHGGKGYTAASIDPVWTNEDNAKTTVRINYRLTFTSNKSYLAAVTTGYYFPRGAGGTSDPDYDFYLTFTNGPRYVYRVYAGPKDSTNNSIIKTTYIGLNNSVAVGWTNGNFTTKRTLGNLYTATFSVPSGVTAPSECSILSTFAYAPTNTCNAYYTNGTLYFTNRRNADLTAVYANLDFYPNYSSSATEEYSTITLPVVPARPKQTINTYTVYFKDTLADTTYTRTGTNVASYTATGWTYNGTLYTAGTDQTLSNNRTYSATYKTSYTAAVTNTAPTLAARTGYTFKGWSSSNGSTQIQFSANEDLNTKQYNGGTFYSIWEPETRVISYNTDSITATSNTTSQYVDYDGSVILQDGSGWTSTKYGSITTYTTNYNFQGGQFSNGATSSGVYKASRSAQKDLVIGGWSNQSGGNQRWSLGERLSAVTSNYSLWPVWHDSTGYVIHANFTPIEAKRPGYKLVCWNTSANGSGTNYYVGTQYTGAACDRDLTLYAIWEPDGIVKVYNNGWKNAQCFIYTNSKWQQVIPYVYSNGSWHLTTD